MCVQVGKEVGEERELGNGYAGRLQVGVDERRVHAAHRSAAPVIEIQSSAAGNPAGEHGGRNLDDPRYAWDSAGVVETAAAAQLIDALECPIEIPDDRDT